MENAHNRESYAGMGITIYGISISFQFCYEPKIVLKYKVYLKEEPCCARGLL
jgi:hypothetical protein